MGSLDPQKLIELKINHMNIFTHENLVSTKQVGLKYELRTVLMYQSKVLNVNFFMRHTI